MMANIQLPTAFALGERIVNRLGYGAMQTLILGVSMPVAGGAHQGAGGARQRSGLQVVPHPPHVQRLVH
jgi:hypothetical protein